MVWEGSDWTNEDQWVHELSQDELKEIDEALAYFRRLDRPLGFIRPETFPLATLAMALKSIAEELHKGKGFCVLREIPIDKYTREELVIVYAGISSYIGMTRGKQDATGAVLGHVKDLSHSHVSNGARKQSAYSAEKQVFHNDAGDLVALFTLQTAEEGGVFRICSLGRVYNELAEIRPDLIKVLAEAWPFDTFGGDPGYFNRPVIFFEDAEHMVIQASRRNSPDTAHRSAVQIFRPSQKLRLRRYTFLGRVTRCLYRLRKVPSNTSTTWAYSMHVRPFETTSRSHGTCSGFGCAMKNWRGKHQRHSSQAGRNYFP